MLVRLFIRCYYYYATFLFEIIDIIQVFYHLVYIYISQNVNVFNRMTDTDENPKFKSDVYIFFSDV